MDKNYDSPAYTVRRHADNFGQNGWDTSSCPPNALLPNTVLFIPSSSADCAVIVRWGWRSPARFGWDCHFSYSKLPEKQIKPTLMTP